MVLNSVSPLDCIYTIGAHAMRLTRMQRRLIRSGRTPPSARSGEKPARPHPAQRARHNQPQTADKPFALPPQGGGGNGPGGHRPAGKPPRRGGAGNKPQGQGGGREKRGAHEPRRRERGRERWRGESKTRTNEPRSRYDTYEHVCERCERAETTTDDGKRRADFRDSTAPRVGAMSQHKESAQGGRVNGRRRWLSWDGCSYGH